VVWHKAGDGDGDGGDSDVWAREPGAPVFFDRRAHAAGVCCVAPHPAQEHLVATGSYDEAIRLWDTRNAARPVGKAQVCGCAACGASGAAGAERGEAGGLSSTFCRSAGAPHTSLLTASRGPTSPNTQVPTGGGTWRLRWHPHDPSLILAACMYNGFAIGRASGAWDAVQIVESYSGHESIAYGADWHPTAGAAGAGSAAGDAAGGEEAGSEGAGGEAAAEDTGRGDAGGDGAGGDTEGGEGADGGAAAGGGSGGGGRESLVATCSFYDRRLHLWTPATRY
jgi:diphthamide biosynthesis protein 7